MERKQWKLWKTLLFVLMSIGICFGHYEIADAADTNSYTVQAVNVTGDQEVFRYYPAGGWTKGAQVGEYFTANPVTNASEIGYTVKFSGTGIALYGYKAPAHGAIVKAFVDGQEKESFHGYAASRTSSDVLLWQISGLADGNHTLKVQATGEKFASAANRYIEVTRAVVTGQPQLHADISGMGSSIQAMFDNADDNTWLFAGGVETQGRYAEIQGWRSYIGQFEENTRRGGDGGTREHNPKHQRYVINVGTAGRDLAGFVEKMDAYIETLDPKAVAYLIGEEDYQKGEQGIADFRSSMQTMITKALAMKENHGFAVIQLPHAVTNEEQMEHIRLYIDAVKEAAGAFSQEEQKRIVVADHYEQTVNESHFIDGSYLTAEGRLNASGHWQIARQFCMATIGNVSNFATATKIWEEEAGVAAYLPEKPTATAGKDSLQVTVPSETGLSGGWKWSLEINEMTICGEAAQDAFVIEKLPEKQNYKLTVGSKDGNTQFASVYGKIKEGEQGGAQQLSGVPKQLAQKMAAGQPLTWLFTGDSITHGLVHTHGYDSVPQLFEKYVREELGRSSDVVVNTAVSATDTEWALVHEKQRITKYCADVVTIMLGTNDVYTNEAASHKDDNNERVIITPERYRSNLKELVRKAREANPDVTIIFRSPTPTTHGNRAQYLTDGGYLDVMAEVAREDGNILLIDQYHDWDQEMRTFSYRWGREFYYGDTNLHPGAAGQLKMFQQYVKETGMSTDTRLANLSYKFAYQQKTSSVRPAVLLGDGKVKIERSALQSAYAAAGGTGNIGELEITLTGEDGRTYTQCTPAGYRDFVMKGIPYGSYQVKVTGTLTDSAAHVAFAEQTVTVGKGGLENFEIVLENGKQTELKAGAYAGVFTMSELAPEGTYTYTLCEGEGSSDNGKFEIKGRTLKIKENLEAGSVYHIRVKAESGDVRKESALTVRTVKSLAVVRKEAQADFAADKKSLDIDVSGFDFNGSSAVNLADAQSSYYAGGAYLEVLNNLKNSSTGGTVAFRFRTAEKGGMIFGAGSTAADDGQNLVMGLEGVAGKLRGYFRIASGNALKGTIGTSLADGAWHTVVMSCDTTKSDYQNQVLISIDGNANVYPAAWWTAACRTWFNSNSANIVNFAIGGGAYTSAMGFSAFKGDIDFLTITDDVYTEEELRILSEESSQKEEDTVIAAITSVQVDGNTLLVSPGVRASEIEWNEDGTSGTAILTAGAGYVFDEEFEITMKTEGYEAETIWETVYTVKVILTKKAPKPDEELAALEKALDAALTANQTLYETGKGNYTAESWKKFADAYKAVQSAKVQGETDKAVLQRLLSGLETAKGGLVIAQMKLAAPAVVSVKSVAEKKAMGVKITVSKVEGAEFYTVYRTAGGNTIEIGRTDARGVVYDANPAAKKEAAYYAVAGSSDAKYKQSDKGAAKTIQVLASVKKVKAKRTGKKPQVKLTWKKLKGAKSYVIYRSLKKTDGFVKIKTVKGAKKTSFTDKKVKKGKTYYYRVVVKTKKGYTAPKASKAVKIKK